MLAALEACTAVLPVDRPRYFMGLGDPVGIVEAVARGIDMFDCVLPTRLGRHGTVLSDAGRYNLSAARHAGSDEPLDPSFPDSPAYDRVCNSKDRTLKKPGRFQPRIDMNVHVESPEHPVTRGVADFAISGEGFLLPSCGADSTVLLTHDHDANIASLAWCHELRRSRVLCWQSGHDASEWTNPGFRQIFQQGIEWLARRR